MRGIYLQTPAGLVEMTEEAYDSESVLQASLAEHPRLLAGDQMDDEEPRRWLLVDREVGVPDREGDGGRWAADHLFVDQDGVPTIVEVKRSSDTRARREVVGQMLDYAAHGAAYWRDGRIHEQFLRTCEAAGRDPAAVLSEWRGADDQYGYEDFWESVETNLRAGHIRMVFVADEISREVKRIVEFLNEQLSVAEVFAVEVKQFTGEGQTALVPTLVGQTEEARGTKSRSTTPAYPELLASVRARVERALGDSYFGEPGSGQLADTATRQLELKLPVAASISRLLIWEIEPQLDEEERIVLRLRLWGTERDGPTLLRDALAAHESELAARGFSVQPDRATVCVKSFDVPGGREGVDDDVEADVVDDFVWFATEVYPALDVRPQTE
jgi:hypothetical protein